MSQVLGIRPEDAAFLADPRHQDADGPTFDLFLWLAQPSTAEAVLEAFLADGRVAPFASVTGHVLHSPTEFPLPVAVGHSHVDRGKEASSVLYIPTWCMRHVCGTDALNDDDLGDPSRMVALYALLMSLARSVARRVPVAWAILRGEAWAWPARQDRDGRILVHNNVSRLTNWAAGPFATDWEAAPLR